MTSVFLSDLTWEQARDALTGGALVVVPIGATEQHGPHLPLDTDWRLCGAVAERAARALTDDAVPVLLTPPVWAGYSPHHGDFAGTVSLEFDTFLRVVGDITRSLWRHGARKILLLNGHGGNTNLLRALVQRLRFEDDVRAVTANYWDFALPFLGEWRESGPGGIDHACEMETSLMLTVRNGAVQPGKPRDATWFPRSGFLTGDLLVGAPVNVAWSFSELNPEGVLGNPEPATPERGDALIEEIVSRLSEFLREFRGWDWQSPRSI